MASERDFAGVRSCCRKTLSSRTRTGSTRIIEANGHAERQAGYGRGPRSGRLGGESGALFGAQDKASTVSHGAP
jgi:hypothetical protein